MATLVSPGVSVSVIDESVTAGAGQGTVPFILIASAQDKATPDGASIAPGTTQAESGKLYLITSQRELLQTFGDPAFQSAGGNQIHGSPLNEYGLLAAYSYLGSANQAYVMRADVDLAELEASVIEPTSPAAAGTLWLDTMSSYFGINVVTKIEDGTPTYEPRDVSFVFSELPSDNSIGSEGDYGVVFDGISDDNGIQGTTGSWYYAIKHTVGASTTWKTLADVGAVVSLFKTPSTANVGDHWIDTAAGSSYSISEASSSGAFVKQSTPSFSEYTSSGSASVITADAQASAYYGDDLAIGDFYIDATYVSGENCARLKQYISSGWVIVTSFYASSSEPRSGAADGALWFNADVGKDGDGMSTVDLLVNNGAGSWTNTSLPGYENAGAPMVFLQSTDPTETGETVASGDIWVDTDQLDAYPVIYKWSGDASVWRMIDTSDQSSGNGILFADARAMPGVGDGVGNNNGAGLAPDLDIDVPDPDAYPKGMLLWNTRFSTQNVKRWVSQHLVDEDGAGIPIYAGRWVSESGNNENGSLKAGIEAQRAVVVKAMQSVLVSNQDIRSEFLYFNIMASPGFPETIDEMVSLNIDRKETGFVIADSPFNLSPDATSVMAWAKNSNGAAGNGQDGLITADPYVGVYYPSGFSTNTDGSDVVVPASHMMLKTMAYNDQVAYPWFAPAGLTRGRLSNASAVGYVDGEGEFVPVTLNAGQRDALYNCNINPLAFAPNEGITAFGQKTRNPYDSALSRINVARLINYIRYQAEQLARPFLFEPNDAQTRDNIADSFNRMMSELVTLRGLDDFVVVCDTSNNTPARIDRNELWVDIAIVPLKAIEFIYIPIRIKNTGGI